MKFSKSKANKELKKKQEKFSEEDIIKILEKQEELNKKFKEQSKLFNFWDDFKTMFSMIKDYSKGNYKQIPWYSISAIGATLIYVLSPIDLIPDFIPVIGYLDDSTVFAICLKLVTSDIEDYREWKKNNYQ